MKHVSLIAATAILMLLSGCGGNDDDSNGGFTPLPTTARVEAVVVDPSGRITDLVQDPMNLQTDEDYAFQLVEYVNGQRQVLSGVVWRSSDENSEFGRLGSNTGRFTTRNRETPSTFSVEALYNGTRYVTNYRILPRQTRLVGKVAVEGNPNRGIDGVVIDFYAVLPDSGPNPPEQLVGTVVTSWDGTFRASIPSGAVRFQVRNASIPSGFYHSLLAPLADGSYKRFDTGTESCMPPLPANLPSVGLVDIRNKPIWLTPVVAGSGTPNPDPCYY